MALAIKAAGAKAQRLLFVFAASVPERVADTALATESAALPVVKSIGSLAFLFLIDLLPNSVNDSAKRLHCSRFLICNLDIKFLFESDHNLNVCHRIQIPNHIEITRKVVVCFQLGKVKGNLLLKYLSYLRHNTLRNSRIHEKALVKLIFCIRFSSGK